MASDTNGMKYDILKNDYLQIKHPATGRTLKLFRIVSLKKFKTKTGYDVKEGEVGGFIEGEQNLSQNDFSWIFNTAMAFDDTLLIDSSIHDQAKIFGNCIVTDCEIRGKVRVWGSCTLNECRLTDNVDVSGECEVAQTKVSNSSVITGKCKVVRCTISGGSRIGGNCDVTDTTLQDVSEITGKSIVEHCHFSGRTFVKNANVFKENRQENIELNIISENG